jgi:hypothetical protein
VSHHHPEPSPADGLVDWIRTVVPAGSTPIGWCNKPIHRHILEKAPDIVDATKDAIAQSFGDTPHVILEIRPDDEAARATDELARALDRTDGGVLLVGVSYALG